MTETPRLLDIVALVAYLKSVGVTSANKYMARALINGGRIPHLKIGKRFFVTQSATDSWLAKSERTRT